MEGLGTGLGVGVVLALVLCGGLVGSPQYDVYSSRMSGQAKLAEADSSREIAVREAKAKMEAADLLAQADVARAKGVAQANQIIGQSLQGNEAYLRYLWIQNLENTKDQIIYVPTEGSLPILEANRFGKPAIQP